MSEPTDSVEQRIRRAKKQIMKIKGVTGVGVGEKDGKTVIQVFLETPDVELPTEVEGFPIHSQHTGRIIAY